MTSRTHTDGSPTGENPETSPHLTDENAHPRAAVAVLCLAGIVVALMQTIIVPLIPQLPTLLNADASNTTWAITITLLVGAVATPIGGRIGDMYGKRLAILGSLAFVALGSVACALATSLPVFIVGRGLQGLGFGIIALGISVMRDIVPSRYLGSAVGTMSASLGIGGALGLPFAAAIAQHVSWHALFWTCAVAAALAAVGVVLTVPSHTVTAGGRFELAVIRMGPPSALGGGPTTVSVRYISPRAGSATAASVRPPPWGPEDRCHSAMCTAQPARPGIEYSWVPSTGSTIQTRSA